MFLFYPVISRFLFRFGSVNELTEMCSLEEENKDLRYEIEQQLGIIEVQYFQSFSYKHDDKRWIF